MPPRPRPTVLFHGRTRTSEGQHVITLSVNSRHYDYHLTLAQADTVEYLCRKVSALKALAFAKSRARLILTPATTDKKLATST